MDKIIKYGLVVLKDGKFLINKKEGVDTFLMPGGKPEDGESPEDCLFREIMEEHDCELNRDSIKFFGEFEDIATDNSGRMVNIKTYFGEIEGEPKTSSEIVEQRWFGKDDDQDILSPIIKNKIFPALLDGGLLR